MESSRKQSAQRKSILFAFVFWVYNKPLCVLFYYWLSNVLYCWISLHANHPIVWQGAAFWGVDQWEHMLSWKNASIVCLFGPALRACMGVNVGLRIKPLAASQSDKVTPENEAVVRRYRDQCGHPWPPVLLYTPAFSISNPTMLLCVLDKTFTLLSPLVQSGFLMHTHLAICQILGQLKGW